jgi:adenylate kinase family enzyme
VYITGSPGAGKTFLANRLARQLGIPCYEMDLDPAAFSALDMDAAWIVEGAYVWNVQRFLERADLIVWLDLPMRHTLRRIVGRHVRLSALGRNRHRGIRLLIKFLWSQPGFFSSPWRQPQGPADWSAITRANHQEMLRPFQAKVVHLRTPKVTRQWARSVPIRTAR